MAEDSFIVSAKLQISMNICLNRFFVIPIDFPFLRGF